MGVFLDGKKQFLRELYTHYIFKLNTFCRLVHCKFFFINFQLRNKFFLCVMRATWNKHNSVYLLFNCVLLTFFLTVLRRERGGGG